MLRDTNATTKFKNRLQHGSESNITALIDKAIAEDINTSSIETGLNNFLTVLRNYTGGIEDFERDLNATKQSIDPDFYLASNGVTIKCEKANINDTGVVNGVTYTKRDQGTINTLMDSDSYDEMNTTCTSGITSMWGMFQGETTFDHNISHWDTSSVTDMTQVFFDASAFNQDIGSWDTSNVTTMHFMFSDVNAFDQNISSWCVSNIGSKPSGFDASTSANFENNASIQPQWGTCP